MVLMTSPCWCGATRIRYTTVPDVDEAPEPTIRQWASEWWCPRGHWAAAEPMTPQDVLTLRLAWCVRVNRRPWWQRLLGRRGAAA